MIDKEKEAINILKFLEDRWKNIKELKRDAEAIEIALNLIQTQQEEIEKLKNKNKFQSKEIEKKDKIKDLMAEWIEKHTKYYDEDGCYCEVEKDICNKTIDCKDCIKQYFERKIK